MTTPRVHLSLASLLIIVSWTTFGSEWRFLAVQSPPSEVFIAPHVHVALWSVDMWRSLVDLLAQADWIDGALAYELSAQGLPMSAVLQAAALLLMITGFVSAGRVSSAASEQMHARTDPSLAPDGVSPLAEGATSVASAEHVRDVPAAEGTTRKDRAHQTQESATMQALDQELSDIGHRLGNLLLNPDAHAVAEPIADVGRRVRQLQAQINERDHRG
jgi:hypothetical protein